MWFWMDRFHVFRFRCELINCFNCDVKITVLLSLMQAFCSLFLKIAKITLFRVDDILRKIYISAWTGPFLDTYI